MHYSYNTQTKTLTLGNLVSVEIFTEILRGLEANNCPVDTISMDYRLADSLWPVSNRSTLPVSGARQIEGRLRQTNISERQMPDYVEVK